MGKHGQKSAPGPGGGTVSAFHCVYQDIVPGERIVYAYRMALADKPISVSLATVELNLMGAARA